MEQQIIFVESIINNELTNFIINIIRNNNLNIEKIKDIIPNYYIELIDTTKEIDNRCIARIFRNGEEKQCLHPKKKGEFCTRHNKNREYGIITEPIPEKYLSKFTKYLEEKNTTIIRKPKEINFNINLFPRNKNNLIKFENNYDILLIDPISNIVYDNSENPIYIGKYDEITKLIYRE